MFLDSCIAENKELIEIAEMPSDKVALDITELFTRRLSELNELESTLNCADFYEVTQNIEM